MTLCNDGSTFNDDEWHFLRIHRAAATIEAQIDDCPMSTIELEGQNFELNVDEIVFGRGKGGKEECFMGYMQGFIYNEVHVFDRIDSSTQKVKNTPNVD